MPMGGMAAGRGKGTCHGERCLCALEAGGMRKKGSGAVSSVAPTRALRPTGMMRPWWGQGGPPTVYGCVRLWVHNLRPQCVNPPFLWGSAMRTRPRVKGAPIRYDGGRKAGGELPHEARYHLGVS